MRCPFFFGTCDQFAFRPTGSLAAAIIYLLSTVTNLLLTNPYVIVISLDFDTVRHSTLMEKLGQLHLPDFVYNWLADFFTEHSHCIVYAEVHHYQHYPGLRYRGPAAYVVNASDLKAVTPGNQLCKFADDTYLVIPAATSTRE